MNNTVKRLVAAGAVAAFLAGCVVTAVPASADPLTVAQCDAQKNTAMKAAQAVAKGQKIAAITAMQAATGSHKDAAATKRGLMKTAHETRKASFVAARTAHKACIALAPDRDTASETETETETD